MSATADCRKTGCTGTRGRRCKTAEGTGNKGVIEAGKDADLLVMDKDLKPLHLFMKGRQVMKDSEVIVKGAFEE